MSDIGNEMPPATQESLVESSDGKSVYAFRYDNPQALNRASNSQVSKDELVGKWFTTSLKGLRTYIIQRPPGGNIQFVKVPKDRIEELLASNHPVAREMDIEADNIILTQDLQEGVQSRAFDVVPANQSRFNLVDRENIDKSIDSMVDDIRQMDLGNK